LKKAIQRIFTFACLILLSHSAMSVQNEHKLPPILDYYPLCSYQLIKNYSAETRSTEPQSPEVISIILNELRKEAKQVEADAVILLEKELYLLSTPRSANERRRASVYRINYQAELIKNCTAETHTQAKLAPYNHQGLFAISDISTTVYRRKINITLPQRVKLNHPEITNREVSISNGLYGLPLGSDYSTVLEKLGDPSAEVMLLDGELIIAYGRRHWLHFQENKLVKVHNNSQFLSSMVLNTVPLRNFFDDYEWKINDKIGYRTTLATVRESLEIDSQLDANGQLKIQQNNSTLTLRFDSAKDLKTGKEIHTLNDFSLQKDSYKAQKKRPQIQESVLYQAVQQAYIALQQKHDINWQELADPLGEPLAIITLSVDAELRVYGMNLLVNTKKSKLTTIHFVEQALLDHNQKNTSLEPWYLGYFLQGQSVAQLEQYFPENAYSYDLEVEMEAEKYNLSLFFEEINDQDSLYEAKLELR
jgi:hypothetical protein